MWNLISVILLIVEIILLGLFVVGKFRNRKLNETFLFLGLVFLINVSLYLIPYLHGILVEGNEGNRIFEMMDLMERSVKLFLGGMSTGDVAAFTLKVPIFTFTYLLGAILAVLTTVSTTLQAFRNSIRNGFRLAKRLKAPTCDIVVGSSESALQYARDKEDCVLLLSADTDKNAAAELMEKDYVLIRKGLTVEFLTGRLLNGTTRYNLICPNSGEDALTNIELFLSYWKSDAPKKNIYLFAELDKDKTETVRHEILESCGCEERVTTFCSNELLARTFVEEHPVTRYLPDDYIDDDASIKADRAIHIYFLGYGELSAEIHRQMVLNNQLVKYENGEYHVLAIHYHIYDPAAPRGNWLLSGMEKTLTQLYETAEAYFPLPEMPCATEVCENIPYYRDTLGQMCRVAKQPRCYTFFVVDTGDQYRNMETGRRLNSILDGHESHHVFVRSDASFTKDSDHMTYYGDFSGIFSHDVIVNDSLSTMAKVLNEVYTAGYMADRKGEPNFAEAVKRQAEEDWNAMDYFTLYSNIHCAVNLRCKLNLLGLDYKRESGEPSDLLKMRYDRKTDGYTYNEYFQRSKRNAMLAQEHARWNAYHLISEFMPMEKSAITVKSRKDDKVKFNTKNMVAKKHCCLTTFNGLDDLGQHLATLAAEQTGTKHTAQEYDVYIYDEMLLCAADELMAQIGFQIVERS